jgi:L-proline amide hydrolase
MSTADVTEGRAQFGDYETWYRVTGDLSSPKLPLVVVHGGPGCTHDYLDNLKKLAGDGRAVIHYDQIGNGKSTHLPEKGADFWTVAFFLGELDSLLDHLGIQDRYALLGQSWGGMLGAEHAVRQPPGLKALIIANSPASMELWSSGAAELRDAMPAHLRAALEEHERLGTFEHPDYQAATRAFYDRHVCRVIPWPAELERTFAALAADPTVYYTMNGPNEFHTIGTLKTWTIIDRLHQITAPTLVIRGFHDEATEACTEPFVSRIAGAEYEVFPHSSHLPHLEEEDAFFARVRAFLARHE